MKLGGRVYTSMEALARFAEQRHGRCTASGTVEPSQSLARAEALLDGRKGLASSKVGARRGLIVPKTLAGRSGLVLVVEGATDVAACEDLGLAAVGRPSCSGGAEDIVLLLDGREILVVGERGPGRPCGRVLADVERDRGRVLGG